MKKNGYDIDECCYKEMTHAVGGQSEPQPYHDEPFRNNYELTRKNYNVHGLDQSGMERRK
jgi:hypothetical protein